MKVIVVDPKGITVEGKRHESGSVVSIPDGAALSGFFLFQQVIPPKPEEKPPVSVSPAEKAPISDPPEKAPAKPK